MSAERNLDRREVVARLLQDRNDLLVVTGLGSPSYDVMAAGDHEHNYYLWAAMGSAVTVGLGLAKAQPDRSVLVVTGDGELMMGMGALASVSVANPKNLSIAVLDNGQFGETGQQRSHAGLGVKIDEVARALDFAWSAAIQDMKGVDTFRSRLNANEGPQLANVKVSPGIPERVLPSRDGVHIKNRFRASIGFQPI